MSLLSISIFVLVFAIGFLVGKRYSIGKMIKKSGETSEYLSSLMREVERRKHLSDLSKTRKRINGRFAKE